MREPIPSAHPYKAVLLASAVLNFAALSRKGWSPLRQLGSAVMHPAVHRVASKRESMRVLRCNEVTKNG